ncbi:MAG: hypothetical protein HOM68_18085 [Gemmatimonadetes bacterium]|jgi:hypothetical protein|nr:hypothetical protein [Gemmatimonadota bacterium]MBT5058457.1 hypothetical protein [Gemmatimonadota bacterium]MBT5141283.1 hypothetical protein [Gemmatimonadota bacterium]MBT5590364.1 hypothetical protein [Gemmatimonadota bacterium]MBT5963897.1 hypothetical protein [Gemmatimonadota bacterium]
MAELNVENLRKQAKSLLKQLKSGAEGVDTADSVRRVRRSLPRLSQVADQEVLSAEVTLQEAQHVIAVEQGLSNWKQLLSEAGESPREGWGTLFVRPGLPNVRREAEWFLWMISRGGGWPMDRIRQSLPRVAEMSNEQITQADVTLAEVQRVVAVDYGFADWETLEMELGKLHPIQNFEDFAALADHEIRQVIFRLGRDRLAVALKTGSDQLMARFESNMSPAAWQALVDAMEALGPMPMSAVEVEQARILEKFRTDDPVV